MSEFNTYYEFFFLGGISGDEKPRRLTFAPNIFSAQHHVPHISRHFEEAPNTLFRGKPLNPFDVLTRLDYLLCKHISFLNYEHFKVLFKDIIFLNARIKYEVFL